MTRLFLILITILICSCQPQGLNQKQIEPSIEEARIRKNNILNIRDTIVVVNEVHDPRIGYAGSLSSQYANYENLLDVASDEDLYELTLDTNHVIATYATFGLIERENLKFIQVFERFLTKDHKVRTMKGCIIGLDLVSSEIYHEYWNKVRLESNNEKVALQNDVNLLVLDSLILETDDANWLLYIRAFENRIYDENYFPLIEQHAFEKGNIYAIDYLFRNHLGDYAKQIPEALMKYLDKDKISPMEYGRIFEMAFKLNHEGLKESLILELDDIKRQYGATRFAEYKAILLENKMGR